MIHALKIKPKFFEAAVSGKKTFEVRRNDRNFREGSFIALNEYDNEIMDGITNESERYTGRSALFRISYILDNTEYCKEGYVVLGIKPCFIESERSGEITTNYGQEGVQ
ncbi:hypothetical protein FACS1894111_05890 [Clostridia bacterium]|nr:hypothetical protein FACS1894111_05890 [Clostridia bacterium]